MAIEFHSPHFLRRLADAPPHLGVFLGSFDPLHRGHERVVETLLGRYGAALVLIPARHPEKTVESGRNAALAIRLEMLATLEARFGEALGIGLARDPLYLSLYDQLNAMAPRTAIHLAMGNDGYQRLLRSREYHLGWQLPWTPREDERLREMASLADVLDRTQWPSPLPPDLSSSGVRRIVATWRAAQGTAHELRCALRSLISGQVLDIVLQAGLYVTASAG